VLAAIWGFAAFLSTPGYPANDGRITGYKEILAQAQAEGTAEVWVELEVRTRSVSARRGSDEYRRTLRDQQNRVLSSVGIAHRTAAGQKTPFYLYENTPLMILRGTLAQIQRLARHPAVKAVQFLDPTPMRIEALERNTRRLPKAAREGLSSIQVIGAHRAHKEKAKGQGQVVVVVDTGFDVNHPYFKHENSQGYVVHDTILHELCISNVTGVSYVKGLCKGGTWVEQGMREGIGAAGDSCDLEARPDACEHGTRAAGIIAGFAGGKHTSVAPLARLVLIKAGVLAWNKKEGFFVGFLEADLVKASDVLYRYIQVMPPKYGYYWTKFCAPPPRERPGDRCGALAAVNLSIGMEAQSCPDRQQWLFTGHPHVRVVAAAGNDGYFYDPPKHGFLTDWPACIPEIIAVASSSWPFPGSEFHSNVGDVFAPGGVVSTTDVYGNYIDDWSGTSAAAPHVAGAFAVLDSSYQLRPGAARIGERYGLSGGRGIDHPDYTFPPIPEITLLNAIGRIFEKPWTFAQYRHLPGTYSSEPLFYCYDLCEPTLSCAGSANVIPLYATSKRVPMEVTKKPRWISIERWVGEAPFGHQYHDPLYLDLSAEAVPPRTSIDRARIGFRNLLTGQTHDFTFEYKFYPADPPCDR